VIFSTAPAPSRDEQDGDWVTNADPLLTATTGFRLTATLQAKPSVTNTVSSSGLPLHATHLASPLRLGAGRSGRAGPDATVRLAVLRSPFYDKLFVAGIQVGVAPPFYVLQDANGGAARRLAGDRDARRPGGSGVAGAKGTVGLPEPPAVRRSPGRPEGTAATAGRVVGGHGGRINVIVPAITRFSRASWRPEAPGDPAARAGPVVRAGGAARAAREPQTRATVAVPTRWTERPDRPGVRARRAARERPGPRTIVVTAPVREIFGVQVPPELGSLLERLQRRP